MSALSLLLSSTYVLFLTCSFSLALDDWHEESNLFWAEHCNWNGNDLAEARTPSEQCGPRCAETSGCTHFSWTGFAGGTCWMKSNSISKNDAMDKTDEYSVCGLLKTCSSDQGGDSSQQDGVRVKGTMWADQTDTGGCQLPRASYSVQHAVALGQSDELGALKWRNGLCGQVLAIDCGGRAIEAIVASTCNLGSNTCGVDLIRKSWDAATGGKQPGIAQCTVTRVVGTSSIQGASTPACFTRPESGGVNAYYVSLGVFNTEGRVVRGAEVAGVRGQFQSGSGYLDFNAEGQPKFDENAEVKFEFEDGSAEATFRLSDCVRSDGVQIWS